VGTHEPRGIGPLVASPSTRDWTADGRPYNAVVSDVPLGPGFPNPFGFDIEQLMRMLQSQGPVNYEIAQQVASAVATTDVTTGEQTAEPAIDASMRSGFDDVVRAAQLSVAEATGITTTLGVSTACVDRSGWARATLDELTPVLNALAGALQSPGTSGGLDLDDANPGDPADLGAFLMQSLLPLLLGVWSGSMIGQLAHHALGQYDLPLPLHGPPTQRFLVSNVEAFGREWTLPIDELRYALALREVVHGAQRSVRWVREELERLATDYVAAYEVQPDALQEQLGELDVSDPTSMAAFTQLGDPSTLLGAMRSDRQGPLLEALQRFVSVLEGYTDVVVETLGERMITSHARIDEALKRHRLERGEAASFVDRLLGLELGRDHYDAGVAFARGVVERAGLEQLNRLWTSRDLMPTRSELEAPGLWLARIDL
jgi:putative hydrolase